MRALGLSALGIFAIGLPVSGGAQIPLAEPPVENATPTIVGGRSSFDLVKISENSLSVALRYGNLIPRSETVILEGRTLTRDRDYTVDYISGLLYLKVKNKPGQTINVSYRYDDTKSQEGVFGSATSPTANGFGFQLSPGAQAFIGMGYTERLADGSVLTGNLLGLANSFSFGGGGLSGVMMMNNRSRAEISSLLGEEDKRGNIEEGEGMAIVQQLQANALGGQIHASYQDIDDRFAGFQSFTSAGFSADQIKALSGEKGLKRTGFGLTGAQVGALSFGGSHNSVGDSNGSITWRSAEAQLAGVSLAWNSLVVDPGFTKFNGLREQDRQALQKEKGMERQSLSLNRAVGDNKASFEWASVRTSDDGQGFWRSNFAMNQGWLSASWFRQSVDDGFNRFGSLREGDRDQLGRERGIDRNGYALGIAPGSFQANFSSHLLDAPGGSLRQRDFNLGVGKWTLDYRYRGIDEAFHSHQALTGDDRNRFNEGVTAMYGLKPHGNDNAGLNATGIERTGFRAAGTIWDFNTILNRVTIENGSGAINFNQLSFTKGKTALSVSQQSATDGFSGAGSLFHTERQVLSDIDGLSKFQANFNTEFGKDAKLSFDWMNASDPFGDAFRQRLAYSQAGINLSYARRGVDKEFTAVGRMVDSERGLLSSLLGFDQTEMIANYSPGGPLKLSYRQTDGINSLMDQSSFMREYGGSFNLTGNTALSFNVSNARFMDTGVATIDSSFTGFTLSHNMGRAGMLSVTQETQSFNGTDQDMPDAQRRSVAYERQLTSSTKFRTEQSETQFDDGSRQTESRNKVSTAITPRVGVSVEDQRILRDGDLPDEARRNYGFWVDFGRGIRLDYGYNRQINGENGTMNSSTTLSGGEFGGLKLGGASYKTNRWDGKRQQHFGNVNFSNATPFEFGFLKDIKFRYNTDTQRDYLVWQKEILDMGFSSAIGNFAFGWDYASQVNNEGVRAIDRTFSLNSDKTGKAPLQASLRYGVRTTPTDEDVMIRDYSVSYQANKFLKVEHAVKTNELQNRGGVLLGSLPLDERKASWTAHYQNDPKLAFDLSWNEIKRDNRNDSLRREARFNATLFADNPSPVQLTYALQQWDRNGTASLAHSYGIWFTQHPGLNQSLSFGIEHLQWGQGRPAGGGLRDWKLRFDFSSRF